MSFLRPLWIALQLLTRLPTPHSGTPDTVAVGRSLLYYPLVGFLIGTLLAVADSLLTPYFPPLLLAALLLVLWVAFTGALHLDGLGDSADGWLGGFGDRERTLAIMHDPRSGPAAIVAVTLVLLVKFSALAAIVGTHHWRELLLVPLLGRALLPLLFLTTPCARLNGMAASLAACLPRRAAWLVAALSLLVVLATPSGMWLVAASLSVFIVLRQMMLARIGGMTGDTAGALVELVEAATLVALAACLR